MLKQYARIDGGCVVELFETDKDIAELFHPDLIWISARVDTQIGDIYADGQFSKPVVVSGKTKNALIADVAEQRYQIETAGITVSDRRINTEREAQSKLNSAFVSLLNGLIPTTDWKADDGSWVQVDLEGLRPIATAVAQHVAACYTAEMQHQAAIIQLNTQAEIDAYDVTTGWPS